MQRKNYIIYTLLILFVSATNNLSYASLLDMTGEVFSGNVNEKGRAYVQDTTFKSVDTVLNAQDTLLTQVQADSLMLTQNKSNADSAKYRSGVILPDSLKAVIAESDSLTKATFKSDTMFIKGGVFPTMAEKFLDEQTRIARSFDTITDPKLLRKQREKMVRDSLKIKTFTETVGLSFVLPGYGQIRNRQYMKLPILYATTGSLAYLTVNASRNFKKYNDAYEHAYSINVPQDNLDELLREKNKYSTQKTVFMIGTALTYAYFIGDAALNYKGDVHPTNKATMLSAIFPGAGQIYNKSYWKLPIIYGGLAAFGYVVDYNNRGYKRFKLAYELLTDGNDATVDEFGGYYSSTFLENTRDSYRRYRDLGIILTCGFYLLNVIDAHVEAYLRRYDVSDDLSMKIEPTIMSGANTTNGKTYDGLGLSMKIKF